MQDCSNTPLVLKGDDVAATSSSPSPQRSQARMRWKNAALKANPSLDTAKLDQVSRQLTKLDGQVEVSLLDIATNLHDLMYPAGKRFRGGEGVSKIVDAREAERCMPPFHNKYWLETLFAVKGRALPLAQWLVYMTYVTLVVLLVVCLVPNYQNVSELKGLQFPLSTLGTALFLLMSFRTNSCYDRWWEGRKLWDALSSRCLDIGRIAQGYVAPKDAALASHLVRLTIAYCVVVKKYVRRNWKVLDELQGILPKQQVDALEKEYNPVLATAVLMTSRIDEVGKLVPAVVLAGLENQVRAMIADAGAMSRIYWTPMPFAYIVHLRSFMMLWLMILPFAFILTMGPYTILLCGVVSYQLLGFEDIGVEIESPFGNDFNDLPVDKLQAKVFNNLIVVLGKLNKPALS